MQPSLIFALEDSRADLKDAVTLSETMEMIRREPEPVDKSFQVKGEEVFYIIFTSGSTGSPKGVQVTADNLNHYLQWSVDLGTARADKQGKVFLNQAPFSFDLSVMDMYTCLASGGTLYLDVYKRQAPISLHICVTG